MTRFANASLRGYMGTWVLSMYLYQSNVPANGIQARLFAFENRTATEYAIPPGIGQDWDRQARCHAVGSDQVQVLMLVVAPFTRKSQSSITNLLIAPAQSHLSAPSTCRLPRSSQVPQVLKYLGT